MNKVAEMINSSLIDPTNLANGKLLSKYLSFCIFSDNLYIPTSTHTFTFKIHTLWHENINKRMK